jgi:hypothetical protein
LDRQAFAEDVSLLGSTMRIAFHRLSK